MEVEVRWVGSGPGAADGTAAGGEPAPQEVGGGVESGQDDVAGCSLKKMVKPSRRGPMVDRLMSSYGASERRACRVLCVTRGTYRYRSCCDPRTELRDAYPRDRSGKGALWISQDPRTVEPRRLGCGQASGVSTL